eukprot:scpid106236/ scgid35511/ 
MDSMCVNIIEVYVFFTHRIGSTLALARAKNSSQLRRRSTHQSCARHCITAMRRRKEVDQDSLTKERIEQYVHVLEEHCGEGPGGISQKLTGIIHFKVIVHFYIQVYSNSSISLHSMQNFQKDRVPLEATTANLAKRATIDQEVKWVKTMLDNIEVSIKGQTAMLNELRESMECKLTSIDKLVKCRNSHSRVER